MTRRISSRFCQINRSGYKGYGEVWFSFNSKSYIATMQYGTSYRVSNDNENKTNGKLATLMNIAYIINSLKLQRVR